MNNYALAKSFECEALMDNTLALPLNTVKTFTLPLVVKCCHLAAVTVLCHHLHWNKAAHFSGGVLSFIYTPKQV